MHFHQYVFSILVLSAYTTAFYVWNSDSAVESPGSKDENVEKRAPFYTWRDEPTESDGTDSNPPTLKIKRKPQKVAESLHARIQREVDYVANKYGRRNLKESSVKGNGDTARQHQPRGSPVKRDNQYSIETAAPASQTNSVAVHQDGTDFSYFASIALGSEGKEMYVLIDSGAANTWVMGADCTTRACNAHNTFGKEDSDTLEVLDKEWSVSYGTGDVSGVIFNDTVSLAGFTIPFSFGGALEASDDFLNYPMDGILGLGRAASNELDVPTIMDVLSQEKKLKANLFGVNLQRHADGATDGEVTFGEWDESKFEGDLKWISSTAKDGLWEIQIDDVSVGDEGVGFKGKKAVIDTGTSFILLPPSDAQKLHAQIPDASIKGATYDLPCSTTANLRFTFAGVGYDVPPKDYVGNTTSGDRCLSNIIPRQYSGPDNWLMGDTFLKNVYAVFDFDQDRIGFGDRKETTNGESASSSSSSSSSSKSSSSGANQSTAASSASSTGSTSGQPSSVSSNAADSAGADPTGKSSPVSGTALAEMTESPLSDSRGIRLSPGMLSSLSKLSILISVAWFLSV